MRTIAFLILHFAVVSSALASGQEGMDKASQDIQRISTENPEALAFLQKAKSLRVSNPKLSILSAHEALRVATMYHDYSLIAQSHVLLSKLTYQTHDTQLSLHHLDKAIFFYKKTNDTREEIRYRLNYIDILIDDNRFDLADNMLNELLPLTMQHDNNLFIALTIIAKGDIFYKKKQYRDAIKEYKEATQYLTSDDPEVQKHLGETTKLIAQSYKRLKNRKQTAIYYRKALDIYTALDNKRLMARTLSALAEAERYLGNFVIALDYSTQALSLFSQLDDPSEQAKANMAAGIIYRHIGRYEKSLSHIQLAHIYYKKVNDIHGIAKASNQIGLIYTRLKQFELAKSFYQLTIDLPEEEVELTTLASALREMAIIDLESGEFDSAEALAIRAKNIYQRTNDKSKESLTARIIGNIYREKDDSSNAIKYYRESLNLAIERGNINYQIKSQTALAGELINRNVEESISLLKDSLVLAKSINNNTDMLYAYRNLHRAEKFRKDYKASLSYAEKEMALNKLLQDEKDNKNLIRTKARLHSFKMEVELESLREKAKFDQLELAKKNNEIEIAEQQNKINELELTKNRYSSIALASLLAVCLIVVLFIYRRFTHSKKRNKELNYLASRDPLTNCYNRRSLFDYLNREFAKHDNSNKYCVIMADIDHFKAVNDNYGHNIGDEVLCRVADIIQSSVRQNDIASRFGGEEFCIILTGANQEQAMRITNMIRQKVEAYEFTDGLKVTTSFGVTSSQFNAKDPNEIINQADMALYRSKAQGRNQVTLWDKSFD